MAKRSLSEAIELMEAKANHKKSKRSNPELFEVRRGQLASEVLTEIGKNPPKWGALSLKVMDSSGKTTTLKYS